MNIWAQLLSELKITLARTPFRDWPAMFMLWLHLRRLTQCLETLFTAWQAGTLPPAPPAPPEAAPVRAQQPPQNRTPVARPRRSRPAPRIPARAQVQTAAPPDPPIPGNPAGRTLRRPGHAVHGPTCVSLKNATFSPDVDARQYCYDIGTIS